MKIFGLTGGIGSGKTTVANAFKRLGIQVVNADQVARATVAVGQPALTKIAEHFGMSILLSDNALDRAQLREIIFTQPEQKKWLEELLHPLIRNEIKNQLKAVTSAYALLESPLLLETNQHELVDKVIVVDTDETTQMTRASQRDMTTEVQIRQIMDSQFSRQERLKRADFTINNNDDLIATEAEVKSLHQSLLALRFP